MNSDSESMDNSGDAEERPGRRSWIVKVAVASFFAPIVMTIVAYFALAAIGGNIDAAFGLGLTDDAFQVVLAASGGLLAGLGVGLTNGVRGGSSQSRPLSRRQRV